MSKQKIPQLQIYKFPTINDNDSVTIKQRKQQTISNAILTLFVPWNINTGLVNTDWNAFLSFIEIISKPIQYPLTEEQYRNKCINNYVQNILYKNKNQAFVAKMLDQYRRQNAHHWKDVKSENMILVI